MKSKLILFSNTFWRRYAHTSLYIPTITTSRCQSTLNSSSAATSVGSGTPILRNSHNALPPLSIMPTPLLVRTLLVTTFLSSPRLLGAFLPIMEKLSVTKNWFIHPDRNPIVKYIMKATFYNNFAAGETQAQVVATVNKLKKMGCHGVILGYARETMASHAGDNDQQQDVGMTNSQIKSWHEGNLRTVAMLGDSDFVGIKYTGAGAAVSKALMNGDDPPPKFQRSMNEVVEAAIAKGARVVIDAEQWVYQDTIDAWTLDLMRKYNTTQCMTDGRPTIYNTMQAYLKSTPDRLTNHLRLAQTEGFTLAFKLVRGAYITSETRSLIHDTKANTDDTYNSIVRNLIMRKFPGIEAPFPSMQFVIAGHNQESVSRALVVHQEEAAAGRDPACLEFGQIQGMADEITCSLAQMRNDANQENLTTLNTAPKVYKALSWGTVQELMQNLMRRAVENRAAVERTKEWRDGLWNEIKRRVMMTLRLRGRTT